MENKLLFIGALGAFFLATAATPQMRYTNVRQGRPIPLFTCITAQYWQLHGIDA